jgi:hypothetical protein
VASSRYVRDLIHEDYPEALAVTLVVKELLAQKSLNEPFSGGLSSYAVVLMVVAVLKDMAQDALQAFTSTASTSTSSGSGSGGSGSGGSGGSSGGGASPCFGAGPLLVRFLSFFGREFDARAQGLRITAAKGERGTFDLDATQRRAMEGVDALPPLIDDPHSKNVARSAFRFNTIQILLSSTVTELFTQGLVLMLSKLGRAALGGRGNEKTSRPNVLKQIVLRY